MCSESDRTQQPQQQEHDFPMVMTGSGVALTVAPTGSAAAVLADHVAAAAVVADDVAVVDVDCVGGHSSVVDVGVGVVVVVLVVAA
eukprot:CAMPEP_0195029702 /NCGR_PEP_ID=MMETSP0326_2-20130528/57241_1 /TAXON_ID=2866 ORGANISM="Crypthecodinium cohnii, Strain Seligo" /NCGR_SAMPLE_ID=MMETSP0326_2 /ASSEMBLY_ACC=CAM_ASM_000348 /LENGTH=85 /DNA_ID=CAMNT_0040052699 /DNA_START=94 /DNA_END=347 /DNA_ORIENTATION=+